MTKCRTCHEPVDVAGTQCPACVWEDKQAAEIVGTDEDMAHLFERREPYKASDESSHGGSEHMEGSGK